MLRRILVVLLAVKPVVHTFSPCPPPRFNVFSDKIVGEWYTSHGVRTVEEVMRSCGGAVQGIRDDGFYLNRADDGFCYFDCGTYSYGPIDGATASSSNGLLVASLSLPSMRIWLLANEGDITVEAAALPRVKLEAHATLEDLVLPIANSRPEFRVERHQQCRMASPTQPWMMQRAQWESRQDSTCKRQEPQGPYQCWIDVADGAISMGVTCVASGYVKEILRSYTAESGTLLTVALLEGRLL